MPRREVSLKIGSAMLALASVLGFVLVVTQRGQGTRPGLVSDGPHTAATLGQTSAAGVNVPSQGQPEICGITLGSNAAALDPTFGASGRIADIPEFQSPTAATLAVDGEDRVVVAGTSDASGRRAVTLVRFTADGTRDASFGSDGATVSTLPDATGTFDRLRAIIPIPGGYLLSADVAGPIVNDLVDLYAIILRYTTDGNLDPSFGTSGELDVPQELASAVIKVLVRPDGRLIIVGTKAMRLGPGQELTVNTQLAQYSATGQLDESFGSRGISVPVAGLLATDAGLQPDGGVVLAANVAGQPNDYGPRPGYAPTTGFGSVVLRYTADGLLDQQFGVAGTLHPPFPGAQTFEAATTLMDGTLVAVGRASVPDAAAPDGVRTDLLVAHYDARGMLDTRFGTGGVTSLTTG